MVHTLSPPLPSIAIWRSGRGVDAELRTAVKAYLNNIVQYACTDGAIWYDRGPAASNYQYLLLLIIISNDVKHFIQRRIAIEQCFDPTKVFTRHKTVLYSGSFLQHFVKTSNWIVQHFDHNSLYRVQNCFVSLEDLCGLRNTLYYYINLLPEVLLITTDMLTALILQCRQ